MINVENFGVDTVVLFEKVLDLVNSDSDKQFVELAFWLDNQKSNWELIDRHSGDINAFEDLDAYKNDRRVFKFTNELWEQYLSTGVQKKDFKLVEQEKVRLTAIFKQYG